MGSHRPLGLVRLVLVLSVTLLAAVLAGCEDDESDRDAAATDTSWGEKSDAPRGSPKPAKPAPDDTSLWTERIQQYIDSLVAEDCDTVREMSWVRSDDSPGNIALSMCDGRSMIETQPSPAKVKDVTLWDDCAAVTHTITLSGFGKTTEGDSLLTFRRVDDKWLIDAEWAYKYGGTGVAANYLPCQVGDCPGPDQEPCHDPQSVIDAVADHTMLEVTQCSGDWARVDERGGDAIFVWRRDADAGWRLYTDLTDTCPEYLVEDGVPQFLIDAATLTC